MTPSAEAPASPGKTELILTARSESQTLPEFVAETTDIEQAEHSIIVVFQLTPREVTLPFRTVDHSPRGEISVICIEEATDSNQSTTEQPPNEIVDHVTVVDRGDYERAVTVIDLYLREWDGQTAIYLGSLSTLLKEEQWNETFRFLHLLTNRIREEHAMARFYLNPIAVASHAVNVLTYLFDTVQMDPGTKDTVKEAIKDTMVDVIDEALEARIRLHAVQYLLNHPTPVSIRTLAEDLHARDEIDAPDVDEIHTALHHVHLPKLVKAGLVVTDKDHTSVEPSKTAERFSAGFLSTTG